MPVTNANINKVLSIMKANMADLPDPSVTLVGKQWKSPFLVLVSCMLSLRTKDETTLPAARRLFELAKTPEELGRLKINQIEKAIYPVGFYKTKARNINKLCSDIIERFDGKVPDEIDTLLTFKGVGRKTANLVLIEGYGKPAICVDTHVHRISNRIGYVMTKTSEETEWALRKKLPKRHWIGYNSLLVTWGQNICRPVSPWCSRCPITKYCPKVGVGIRR